MSGDGNKISGDYNTSTGKQNKIGYHAGLTKSSKRGSSGVGNDYYTLHNNNVVHGTFNRIGLQNYNADKVNYSFIAGHSNTIEWSNFRENAVGVALGSGAYVNNDIRFALSVDESNYHLLQQQTQIITNLL